MMRRVLAAALAVAFGTATAGMAQAATLMFDLTQDGCSSHCLAPGVTTVGTVEVDAVGGALKFTVDLKNGALFNAAGQGDQHHAMVFDLDKTGLTVGGISTGFGLPTHKVKGNTVSDPGPYNDSPFGGAWNYAIDYTGTAQQGSTPDQLKFTVSDSALDLTLNDLRYGDIYNGLKLYAASDVYANGTTGNVGAPMDLSGPVPEPATWAMVIVGMGMLGGALRGRRRIAPPVAAA